MLIRRRDAEARTLVPFAIGTAAPVPQHTSAEAPAAQPLPAASPAPALAAAPSTSTAAGVLGAASGEPAGEAPGTRIGPTGDTKDGGSNGGAHGATNLGTAEEPAGDPAGARGRIAGLEQALAAERASREAAVAAALERGRDEGRREADDLAAQRLAALREGIAMASSGCMAALDDTTHLAVRIARAGVAKVLGEDAARAAMVADVVRGLSAELAASTVLAVRVSAADFPDDSPEAAALARLAPGQAAIVREPDLPGGSCLFELALGTLDASLGLQARALDAELARFAQAPGDAA